VLQHPHQEQQTVPNTQTCISTATAALFLFSTSLALAQDTPDYRTTVDFIVKHGTGIQNGNKSKVTELERCKLRFAKTSFKSKRKDQFSLSFTVDFDSPIRTDSYDVPFAGIYLERLVKQGGSRNRFHFHMTDEQPMLQHLKFHTEPEGVVLMSQGILDQIGGLEKKTGVSASAPSQYMYWMIPGHRDEVPRKIEPLRRALTNLIRICGGVEETDFGVFGKNTEKLGEE